MTKPENFITSSDYATLKNDAVGSLSVTLPSSTAVPGSTTVSWTDTITIGTPGSSIRSRVSSTKNGVVYAGNSVSFYSTTGGSGPAADYYIYTAVHRVSATQVRLTVFIQNSYGSTQTITGLAQTITARVATFLPPTP